MLGALQRVHGDGGQAVVDVIQCILIKSIVIIPPFVFAM
jgi:hypothetical protein